MMMLVVMNGYDNDGDGAGDFGGDQIIDWNLNVQDPGHLVIDEDGLSSEGQVNFAEHIKIDLSDCKCKRFSHQGPMTMSPLDVDYDMNYLNDDTPPAPGMVKTIGANGKVEWKRCVLLFLEREGKNTVVFFARYKQYTKDDILAAIEEVELSCHWNLFWINKSCA